MEGNHGGVEIIRILGEVEKSGLEIGDTALRTRSLTRRIIVGRESAEG